MPGLVPGIYAFFSKQDVEGRNNKPAMTQTPAADDQTAVVIHCSSFCLGAAPT
jgi:hypothetical protein